MTLAASANDSARAPGLRRHVFFLGGFDPKGVRFYYRLYREGAQQRNAGATEHLHVSDRRGAGRICDCWDIEWTAEPAPDATAPPRHVDTCLEFMRWEDIVRRHWSRSPRRLLRDFWNLYVEGWYVGILQRCWRQARGTFWLAMLPAAMGLVSALVCGLIFFGLWAAVGRPQPIWTWPWVLAGTAGLAITVLVWRWLERKLESEWMLRVYSFCRAEAHDELPELEARIDELAARVADVARTNAVDEVLIVGFSMGTPIAVSVCARALAQAPELGVQGPSLGLLTLGHCTTMLAAFPEAQRFRSELAALADIPQLTWLDYSAPADWAAFAGTPPWPHEGRARLAMASPRFHLQMDAAAYRSLRRAKWRLHLHYLRPPELPSGYDFFELTAGPLTLQQRYEQAVSGRTP